MKLIELRISEDKKILLLLGNMEKLQADIILIMYLENYGLQIVKGNQAKILFSSPQEMEEALKDIIEIFQECGWQVQLAPDVRSAYEAQQSQSEDFFRFTEKASDIRDGRVDPIEFKAFAKAIEEKFSGNRQLYPQQLLAAYHMAFAQHACNFSVPGAGKTSIVYGAFAYLNSLGKKHKKYVDKLLVISPLSAFAPWIKEYKDCFGIHPSHQVLTGMNYRERQRYLQQTNKAELTLISYPGTYHSQKDIIRYLSTTNDDVMVVLDEAHRIRKIDGSWAQAVLAAAKYAKSRIALTGTPAPNSYADLSNLFKFIYPEQTIINMSVNHLHSLSNNSESPSVKQEIEELTKSIQPLFMRIKKAELGIPSPKTHNILIDLPETQRAIYAYIENKCLVRILAHCPKMLSFIRE